MSKRNNHLQPNFYIKGFCSNPTEKNSKVWVYEKGKPFYDGKTEQFQNPRHLTTEKAARKRDFYSFEKEDGTKDYEKYENLLRDEFEEPARDVIEKIRNLEDVNNEEKERLYNYVASMVMRGDNWKLIGEDAETVNKPLVESDIERDVSEIVSIAKKQGDNRYSDERNVRKILTEYIKKEKEKRKIGEYEKSLMVRFAKRFKDEILENLKFTFFISPKYMSFFTSDNPVCYTSFNQSMAQLVFPMSSKICLIVYKQMYLKNINWQRKSEQFWQIDDKTTERIRDFVTRRAIKEIYYSQKAEWLVKFIDNRN